MNAPLEHSTGSPKLSRGTWIALAVMAGATFGIGLFLASAYGFAGRYLWSVIFLLGTGAALALFWSRRAAAWYWPTATVLIGAHVLLITAFQWHLFSRSSTKFGSAPMLKGAFGADFAINALLLYVVYEFFDPSSVAQTRPLAVAKAIKLGFAILALTTPVAIALLVITHRPPTKLTAKAAGFYSNSSQIL